MEQKQIENKLPEVYKEPEVPENITKKGIYHTDTILKLVSMAGKLKLTPQQKKTLYADFKPEEVEIREDGVVYLPFIFYAERLYEAFGTEWAMVAIDKPQIVENDIVWGFVLVIRGMYIDTAYGSARYFATNQKMSYTDCIEGAKSECLRRLCKGMGIGLKLWKPEYIRDWKAKYTIKRNGKWEKRTTESQPKAEVKEYKQIEKEIKKIINSSAFPEEKKAKALVYLIKTDEEGNEIYHTLDNLKKFRKHCQSILDTTEKQEAPAERTVEPEGTISENVELFEEEAESIDQSFGV